MEIVLRPVNLDKYN